MRTLATLYKRAQGYNTTVPRTVGAVHKWFIRLLRHIQCSPPKGRGLLKVLLLLHWLPVYVVALQKVYAVCLLSEIAYLLYYMYHHKEQLVHLTIIIDTYTLEYLQDSWIPKPIKPTKVLTIRNNLSQFFFRKMVPLFWNKNSKFQKTVIKISPQYERISKIPLRSWRAWRN